MLFKYPPAKSPDPGFNGLLAMTGTFIDSIFVNTITTLTIVVTGVWKLTPAAGLDLLQPGTLLGADQVTALPGYMHEVASQVGYNLANGGLDSTALTVVAFNSTIPYGGVIIAIASFFFGYSTLIAWAYYGEQCIGYIWGIKSHIPYRIVFIGLTLAGALMTGKYLKIVWNIGDTFNAIMAIPNLIALLALTGVVSKITREYYEKKQFEQSL